MGQWLKTQSFNIHLHSNGVAHVLPVTGHAGESETARVVLWLGTRRTKKTRLDTEERTDAG